MKAETADTIYREIVRRSSADGLAYLREQLAAHEAKGYESGQRVVEARQWAETRALGA
jgi:hypothetical protein